MKNQRELTLKKLEEAGQVKYKKTSVKTISAIKALFLRRTKQDFATFKKIHPRTRFLCFYIWRAYFQMLSWHSFVEILNEVGEEDNIIKSRIRVGSKGRHSVHGGLFGIAISAIVASVAAAASKAAAVAATTAAVIGTSTAAKAVASSIAGGIGGALAGVATEAIVKKL